MSTNKLSEDLRRILDSGDCGLAIAGLPEKAEALESERDALKAEVERMTPLLFRPAPCHAACEATAFNIELRKLKAELEAARKQEPVAHMYIGGIDWQISQLITMRDDHLRLAEMFNCQVVAMKEIKTNEYAKNV